MIMMMPQRTLGAVVSVLFVVALIAMGVVLQQRLPDGAPVSKAPWEPPAVPSTIASNVTFSHWDADNSKLTFRGKVQRIERAFPKVGPFTFKLTRTILIEGVDVWVDHPPKNIRSFLRQRMLKHLTDADGFKLVIKSLNIHSKSGKKTYESIEL